MFAGGAAFWENLDMKVERRNILKLIADRNSRCPVWCWSGAMNCVHIPVFQRARAHEEITVAKTTCEWVSEAPIILPINLLYNAYAYTPLCNLWKMPPARFTFSLHTCIALNSSRAMWIAFIMQLTS